ncbi:843_t:CDS:1, partial [Gigaspora rosea]
MTWHTYFDKNNVQDWSIYGFHKNWILIYEQEYENLIYDKAVDTLVKSLHEVINRSSDLTKIQKAFKS